MSPIKQALHRAAERKAEFPGLPVGMCFPRGRAGDQGFLRFYDHIVGEPEPRGEDTVLFLLFLKVSA